VWLYLLILPIHVVGELGIFSIPAVMLASFALLGLLEIGYEIENPFGYHPNDLVIRYKKIIAYY
jgi:putative membrane protein